MAPKGRVRKRDRLFKLYEKLDGDDRDRLVDFAEGLAGEGQGSTSKRSGGTSSGSALYAPGTHPDEVPEPKGPSYIAASGDDPADHQ